MTKSSLNLSKTGDQEVYMKDKDRERRTEDPEDNIHTNYHRVIRDSTRSKHK